MTPLRVTLSTLAAGALLFVGAHGAARGWLGDVLVVVCIDAALAAAGVGTARTRLLAVAALSCGVELLQTLGLVGRDGHWLAHLVLGSTFDPVDLAMYGVGLAAAAALERRWSTRRPPLDP